MANKRTLIVEDDEGIRCNLRELLESEGYSVDHAANGRDALAILKSTLERPSLILLDLMMPVMDGAQFRAVQESDPVLGEIPVVIMTAERHIEAKQQKLGAKGYVSKPFDIGELFQKLEEFCA